MADDFQVIRGPKTPYWRGPVRRRRRDIGRWVLRLLTAMCLVFLFTPPPQGYNEAISLQLAQGNSPAWLLFATLGLALSYLAVRLWRSVHHSSSLFCLGSIGGLTFIATTNPLSLPHLAVFVTLCFALLAWMFAINCEFSDPGLLGATLLCLAGIMLCPQCLGIGERMIVLSALVGINVLFREYVVNFVED